MGSRLYVGNLSPDASADALRSRFSECGVVADVKIATDRYSDEPRGFAFVTMASDAEAAVAIARLDGAMVDGKPLRVSEAPQKKSEKEDDHGVKIAQQFREKNNMTYDLDCAGAPLTVRIFSAEGEKGDRGEEWRVEARTSDVTQSLVVIGSGATRRDALGEVAKSWREQAVARGLATFDWDAITRALTNVRAI